MAEVVIDRGDLDQIEVGEQMEVEDGRLVLVNGSDEVHCAGCGGSVRVEVEADDVLWFACKCNEWIAGVEPGGGVEGLVVVAL